MADSALPLLRRLGLTTAKMLFTASKGKPFREEFSFKNSTGKEIAVPNGKYLLHLENGNIIREFSDLRTTRSKIYWTMDSDEIDSLEFPVMYFTLTFNGAEIARGVLRVK